MGTALMLLWISIALSAVSSALARVEKKPKPPPRLPRVMSPRRRRVVNRRRRKQWAARDRHYAELWRKYQEQKEKERS